MPELRKDPLVGRWVIIATERARRPGNFVDPYRSSSNEIKDSFLNDHNNNVKEVYAMKNGSSWLVKVLRIDKPLLSADIELKSRRQGLYEVLSGYGFHEIVIESSENISSMADLSLTQIENVLKTYVARLNEIGKDPKVQFAYIYKSYDGKVLAKSTPSYSQIVASPVIPLHIRQKLSGAKKFYEFHERCIYDDLIKQELVDRTRVINETEHFVALTPFASRFPFEVNIFPKVTLCDFPTGIKGKEADLARVLKDILLRFKIGLDDPAYTMVINSSPFMLNDAQLSKWRSIEDDYCWHIEITPRLTHVAGFEKGTDFYICSIPPENTAEYLKEVELP